MRIAVISDIHGNRTAFEAVLADLKQTVPDLIFHGGDLSDGGANPAEILDRVRDLGWPGVVGNTDEMLFDPSSLTAFASTSPQMQPLVPLIEEMAASTREALGEARIAWLRELPREQNFEAMTLVHAAPASCWRAPWQTAGDEELEAIYGKSGRKLAIYGHIHHSYIREIPGLTVVNTGSVSLSYDGDRRAAYLLLDDGAPAIRRVEYDVEREIKALHSSGIPHAGWLAKILETARPQMP